MWCAMPGDRHCMCAQVALQSMVRVCVFVCGGKESKDKTWDGGEY